VTDRERLERRYRRLLAWYPSSFRRESADELLAILMARARDGQRRPGLKGSLDLVGGGLWMRLRPRVPEGTRTVRVAVQFMYAGALLTALSLAASVAALGEGRGSARLRLFGHLQSLSVDIVVGVFIGGALIALWLWMARAIAQGKQRARVTATVLFVIATVHLFGNRGVASMVVSALLWSVGLVVVWLLWRPSSREYFRPSGVLEVH